MTLLTDLCIPVVEVWEMDFRLDPEGVVRKALCGFGLKEVQISEPSA